MRKPRTDEKLMTPTSAREIAWLQKLTSTVPSHCSRAGAYATTRKSIGSSLVSVRVRVRVRARARVRVSSP